MQFSGRIPAVTYTHLTAKLAHIVGAEARGQVQALLVFRLAGEYSVHSGGILHSVYRVQQSLSQHRNGDCVLFLLFTYQIALIGQAKYVGFWKLFYDIFRVREGHDG